MSVPTSFASHVNAAFRALSTRRSRLAVVVVLSCVLFLAIVRERLLYVGRTDQKPVIGGVTRFEGGVPVKQLSHDRNNWWIALVDTVTGGGANGAERKEADGSHGVDGSETRLAGITAGGEGEHWPGWANIKNLFVFGDSYSDLAFNIRGHQPSDKFPFGNCRDCRSGKRGPYPDCMPKKWSYFLTTTYNASLLRTYALAVGGATIDAAVVPPYWNTATPFRDQILTKFLPYFSHRPRPKLPAPPSPTWRANDTLAAVMFGINDILLLAPRAKPVPVPALTASYKASVRMLHEAGLRNFLLLATPPLDATEKFDIFAGPAKKRAIARRMREAVVALNAAHEAMCAELRRELSGATVWRFDTERLYREAEADVGRFEQTAMVKETGQIRKNCEEEDRRKGRKGVNCDRGRGEFFWSGLHPTYPIQNATAGVIVRDCFGEEVGGYCDWGGKEGEKNGSR